MGVAESTIGAGLQRFLMPKEVPDWYRGGKLSLPKAPKNCMKLLGHVRLDVSSISSSKKFYADVLGGGSDCVIGDCEGENGEDVVISAGASQIWLKQVGEKARSWPGYLYIWVADIEGTLTKCRDFEKSTGLIVVDEVHNIMAEDSVDALELIDPDGTKLIVNKVQAGFLDRMSKSGFSAIRRDGMVCLVEVVYQVPPGVSQSIGRFFHNYMGAHIAPWSRGNGWAVHFQVGQSMCQTLCFAEDPDMANQTYESASVSMYMPSEDMFRTAFEKCAEVDVVGCCPDSLEAALQLKEFRIKNICEPHTKDAVTPFECIVRHPDHKMCM